MFCSNVLQAMCSCIEVAYHFFSGEAILSLKFPSKETSWWENKFVIHSHWLSIAPVILGWEWKQHIYKFIPLPWAGLSWTEAEKYCEQIEGGHLLSIRTRKESRWVTERIRQIRQIIGFSKFWIGASDFGHEGTFQWSDDTNNRPINFTRYTGGEAVVLQITCLVHRTGAEGNDRKGATTSGRSFTRLLWGGVIGILGSKGS